MRVRIVDSVGLTDDTTTAIGHEVETIWANEGVHVDAAKRSVDPRTAERGVTLYVLLRNQMPFSPTVATGRHAVALDGPIGLAWIPFIGNVAGRVIFVSIDNVQRLLSTFSYAGRDFERCPSRLMHTLMGRALGRIVAHEIGHFLYGAAHSNAGLMKPMLDDFDLLGEHLPSIACPSIPATCRAALSAAFAQSAAATR